MKIRIISDGTVGGTKAITEEGEVLPCARIEIHPIDAGNVGSPVTASLLVYVDEIDLVAEKKEMELA